MGKCRQLRLLLVALSCTAGLRCPSKGWCQVTASVCADKAEGGEDKDRPGSRAEAETPACRAECLLRLRGAISTASGIAALQAMHDMWAKHTGYALGSAFEQAESCVVCQPPAFIQAGHEVAVCVGFYACLGAVPCSVSVGLDIAGLNESK